jgi:PAS domain S-box-containing protein
MQHSEIENQSTNGEVLHAGVSNVLWHAKIDFAGNFYDTYISDTVDTLLDLPLGSINSQWNKFFEFVHPDDLSNLLDTITLATTTLGDFGYEYRLKLRSGKIKTVFSNGNVFRNKEGGYVQGFGVTTELSYVKQKAYEIKKSEQKYKALLNILPYPTLVLRHGQIEFMNSATMEFAGVQAEHELTGMNLIRFMHPDDRVRVDEHISRVMDEEITLQLDEERFITPLNETKYVEMRGLPFIDSDGEKSLLLAFSDITEKRLAEKALSESEQRYKTLFELAPFPILVHCEGKIVLINQAGKNYMGTSDEEILKSKSILDFVHPESLTAVKQRIKEMSEMGKPQNMMDEKLISYDGTILDMEVAASPLVYNGKPAILVVMNDISERKKDKKRLEELVATKDRFFSIIAHDLKNPFHQILGFGEIISSCSEDYDLEQTQKIVQYMYNSAQKGYALLENLLEWSRAQTGRIKYIPTELCIGELVEDEVDFFRPAAINKSITISYEISEYLPNIFADKEMLKTVLRNLISNALKFTFRGGRIKIEVKIENLFVSVNIADSGIGIPPDALSRIFKIDETNSTTGTENETGTGLGLILCKEFCEKNGGTINVKSAVGKGSTFNITIPIYKN